MKVDLWKAPFWALTALIASFNLSFAQNAYSVPKDVAPVMRWVDGFTPSEAEKFRQSYKASDIFTGNDTTAFAYLNLSQVVPTADVQRGGPVVELERNLMDGFLDVVADSELGRMSLGDLIKDPRSRLQAMLVVHEGKVVFEAYPGMPKNMKHAWMSTSKTISALIIHQLVDEGGLSLDARVSDYLDYTVGTPIGDVLIRDVLNMRTGLDYVENQKNRTNPNHPVSWAFAAAMSERGVPAGQSLSELLVKIDRSEPPNSVYGYSTFNTQILLSVIEHVTNKPWNRVVSERIWQKLGAESDLVVALSPRGEILGGGMVAGTMEDFAKYSLLYTPSQSVVTDQPLVTDNFFKELYASVNPEIYLVGDQGPRMIERFKEQGAPIGNAYQWDAVFRDGDLYKSGLLGQGLYVSPSTDTTVIWFSTTWNNVAPAAAYSRAIVNKLFRAN